MRWTLGIDWDGMDFENCPYGMEVSLFMFLSTTNTAFIIKRLTFCHHSVTFIRVYKTEIRKLKVRARRCAPYFQQSAMDGTPIYVQESLTIRENNVQCLFDMESVIVVGSVQDGYPLLHGGMLFS